MRTDALREAIAADRAEGLHPFCLVGVAGTTTTGAIDDLPQLAAIAAEEKLWFHVDAAYGGFFALTERGRAALAGIERADSVTLDPHKSLFFPFGTGCLMVRDAQALRRAHELHSACVVGIASEGRAQGGVNYADLSIEQTREPRGLRLWLPLNLVGVRAFREALDEKIDLARYAASVLSETPNVALVCRPELSIFAFRAHIAGLGDADSDALNAALLEGVNRTQRFHLAGAQLDGRLAIRFCVQSLRTHRETVDACLSCIREVLAERVQGAAQ